MNCLDHIINQLKFNYKYALDLIRDVKDDQMAFSPAQGLENHPAFTIGHLITAYGLSIKYLGGRYTVKKEWDELFKRKGPGDPRLPVENQKLYPSKEELILELSNQHELLLEEFRNLSEGKLYENVSWRYSNYFPKIIDLLSFMCITHYSMHLGQLAAWRRALNLPSSLARL
jgi:DinB family protein